MKISTIAVAHWSECLTITYAAAFDVSSPREAQGENCARHMGKNTAIWSFTDQCTLKLYMTLQNKGEWNQGLNNGTMKHT